MIRVLIVDDQALVRAGFRVLLDGEGDMTVVGEASTGKAAVTLARQERPEVVLMDIRMPVLDGIEATRQIANDPALEAVRVLILTTFENDDYVFEGCAPGPAGFSSRTPSQPSCCTRSV